MFLLVLHGLDDQTWTFFWTFSELNATLLSNLADILLLCKASGIICEYWRHPFQDVPHTWGLDCRQEMLQLHLSDQHFYCQLRYVYFRGLTICACEYNVVNLINHISTRWRLFEELSNRLMCFCVLFGFGASRLIPCTLGLPQKLWDNIAIGLVLVKLPLRIELRL